MTEEQYNRLFQLNTEIEGATGNLEDLLTGLRRAPIKEYRKVEQAMRIADNAALVLHELCTEINPTKNGGRKI